MSLTEKNHPGGFILSVANGHRSFDNVTIASGEADLQAGTVLGKVTSTGSYVQFDPEACDGSETAAGILFAATDAASAAAAAVAVVRDAEVIGDELVWPDDLGTDDKDAALASLKAIGIVAR